MTPSVPFPLRQPAAGIRPPIADVAIERFEPATRLRIWDLPAHLLCSIVGTCMTTGELRKLVGKVTGRDLRTTSDVDVHTDGVTMAGERGAGGKAIQKALDLRHAGWLKRLGRQADLAALHAGWDEALASGDIPGAYWALMSHPATDAALTRRAFGDVHMLSHLVGASNRADIRKLTQLETEKAELADRVERQQARLRQVIDERDAARRQVEQLVIARCDAPACPMAADDEVVALRALVDRQRRRIEQMVLRNDAAERRASTSHEQLDAMRERLAASEARAREYADGIAALEHFHDGVTVDPRASLAGRTLLYVGGQTRTASTLASAAAAHGGHLLHHDGGTEERLGALAGLVSRCDVALFPVDCISHEGALNLKRLCRQFGRPYVPLRSAGLSSLLAAFARIADETRLPETATSVA